VTISPDRTTLTVTPGVPLLANQAYSISAIGVEDTAGNKSSFSSSFTTALAAGTNLTLLPTTAVVTAAPSGLFANGQTTATVTITNIARNGILVPDGTVVGVSADASLYGLAEGGTIIGGVTSSQDARFQLATTLNGSVTVTYQSPNRPDVFNGGTGRVWVASVDAGGAPISALGNTSISLTRGSSAVINANPSSLLANGTSYSAVTISVTDTIGNTPVPVPAGVTYAVTTVPVFVTGYVAGTLGGGTVAPDNRFTLYQTIPGGTIPLTYTAPLLAAGQTASSYLQLAKVDSTGTVLSSFGATAVTGGQIQLNGSTGPTSPQPIVLALSPANGQVNVGTTTPVSAKFSLPVNRSTIATGPSGTFAVNLTGTGTYIPGTVSFSASELGPDTIVTFTPGTPYPINASVSVSLTAGIQSTSGQALRSAASSTFSVGLVPDTIAPTVGQANPVNGSGAAPTNSFISVGFSEPINATTVNPTTFAVTVGGTPVVGRFTFAAGGAGPNSIVTFLPNQVLTPNTSYVVSISNGLTDSAGNGVIPATMTFTTSGGIDNVPPTIVSSVPTSGASGFPATGTPLTITLSEPANPLTVSSLTVLFSGGGVPATVTLSANNTVITVTPTQPFFAGTSYTLLIQGVQDVAGNPLTGTSIGFTTVLAPGTTNLPTGATVASNPPQVFANGLTTSQMTITVTRNGTLVPNGTTIAVSADPSLVGGALGGTISGASVGPSVDGRFLLFQTFGSQVVVTYTPPDLVDQGFSTSGQTSIRVYCIDLDTRPVSMIGSGSVTLTGPSSAVGSANPTTVKANGSSTSTITFNQIKDSVQSLIPDGTRIGIRVASLYNSSYSLEAAGSGGGSGSGSPADIGSAWNGTGTLVPAGTISGGTTSAADPTVQIFTTMNGQVTATYQSPFAFITGSIVIQAVAVDGTGLPVRFLGQTFVTLTQ
jgi:hypothetical protein